MVQIRDTCSLDMLTVTQVLGGDNAYTFERDTSCVLLWEEGEAKFSHILTYSKFVACSGDSWSTWFTWFHQVILYC